MWDPSLIVKIFWISASYKLLNNFSALKLEGGTSVIDGEVFNMFPIREEDNVWYSRWTVH